MPDDDRNTFLLLHESDLRMAGEMLATKFHEAFSQNIEAGIVDALSDLGHDDADHDLLIPSLKHHIHTSLASLNVRAANGWAEIFFTNLSDHYNGGDE